MHPKRQHANLLSAAGRLKYIMSHGRIATLGTATQGAIQLKYSVKSDGPRFIYGVRSVILLHESTSVMKNTASAVVQVAVIFLAATVSLSHVCDCL